MKALQDRSIAQEGVIARLCKRNGTLTDEQEQYKEALCTLNTKVNELREKLKEVDHQKKKEQEAKATVGKELTTLLGQVETAKADTVKEFKASQPFIDSSKSTMVMGLRIALNSSNPSTLTLIYPRSPWTTPCW